jgi:hypothetical protein
MIRFTPTRFGRPASLGLALATLGTLAACGGSTLPETSVPASQTVVVAPGTATTVPAGNVVVLSNTGSTVALTPARLTGLEVRNLIAGNTASGTTRNGTPYWLKFQSGGTVAYHEGDYGTTGSWRVASDSLCSAFPHINNGVEECYTLYRTADGTNFVYERPDGHAIGSFTVSPGV